MHLLLRMIKSKMKTPQMKVLLATGGIYVPTGREVNEYCYKQGIQLHGRKEIYTYFENRIHKCPLTK